MFYPRGMAQRTDTFDLAPLKLLPGAGRRLELEVALDDLVFGEDRYAVDPARVPVVLDLSRMTGGGYALRLRFSAGLVGPCMRCLEPAHPVTEVDAREVDAPGGGDELTSPYITDEVLDLQAWARDAFALALPSQVVCRPDCRGLCPSCGENLNEHPDHEHEREPDPRWNKLREISFE